MKKLQNNQLAEQGYYINKKRKIVDFIIGFCVGIISYSIFYLIANVWAFHLYSGSIFLLTLLLIITPIITLTIAISIRTKRKYVISGVIVSIVFPFAFWAITSFLYYFALIAGGN